MYSILTLANSSYFKFLTILINSSLDKCDFDKIDNFYIFDTGLESHQIEWIHSKHKKLKVIATNLNTGYEGGPWGKDWLANVKNKTSILYQLHVHLQTSLLLVDSDMMFVNDPYSLIQYGGDIQVCIRPDHPTKYIGSFIFILEPTKVTEFIYDWMTEVQLTNTMPPESPSLCKVVSQWKTRLNISEIDQSIVNVLYPNQLTDSSVIVHFKGSDLINDLDHQYSKRLGTNGWPDHLQKYLEHNV
jgi:hypothetical protein